MDSGQWIANGKRDERVGLRSKKLRITSQKPCGRGRKSDVENRPIAIYMHIVRGSEESSFVAISLTEGGRWPLQPVCAS